MKTFRLTFGLACLGLALLGPGCSELRKARECKGFIEAVNASLVEIQKLGKDAQRAAEDMRRVGELYEALGSKIEKQVTTDATLAAHAARYGKLCTEAAAAARALATAVTRLDHAGAVRAQERLAQLEQEEVALVRDINVHCGAP